MKSSSIELVPENLLASHKRKLYAEDKITPAELELVEKIKDKVLENKYGYIYKYKEKHGGYLLWLNQLNLKKKRWNKSQLFKISMYNIKIV